MTSYLFLNRIPKNKKGLIFHTFNFRLRPKIKNKNSFTTHKFTVQQTTEASLAQTCAVHPVLGSVRGRGAFTPQTNTPELDDSLLRPPLQTALSTAKCGCCVHIDPSELLSSELLPKLLWVNLNRWGVKTPLWHMQKFPARCCRWMSCSVWKWASEDLVRRSEVVGFVQFFLYSLWLQSSVWMSSLCAVWVMDP